MRQALAPILFDDDDKAAGEALQISPVAPARRSPRAERKAQRKRTDQGEPVHSFQTLLADLATLTKNRIQVKLAGAEKDAGLRVIVCLVGALLGVGAYFASRAFS
jgi:CHASE3 domain sensor protein